MLDLIWDIFENNEGEPAGSKRKLQREKDRFQDARSMDIEVRLRELEKRHEQLKLVTLSLWSLLRDHSGLMESDLRKYVENIDRLDGKRDGQVRFDKEKVPCSECGRIQLSHAMVCPYCGGSMRQKNPFASA